VRDATATAALLLPGWVRVVGALVLLAVAGVLVRRAAGSSGSSRTWHGVYAVTALAMALMFAANSMVGPGPNWAAVTVMVVGVVGVVLVAARLVRDRATAPVLPWVIALVDLVILVYIQIPSPSRPLPVCVLFAAYLAVQVVARGLAAVRGRHAVTAPVAASYSLVGAAGGPAPAPEQAAVPTVATGTAPTAAVLSVLALAMLYMISI
jgi:hypothetical protein